MGDEIEPLHGDLHAVGKAQATESRGSSFEGASHHTNGDDLETTKSEVTDKFKYLKELAHRLPQGKSSAFLAVIKAETENRLAQWLQDSAKARDNNDADSATNSRSTQENPTREHSTSSEAEGISVGQRTPSESNEDSDDFEDMQAVRQLLEIQSEFQELVAQIMPIFEEASILAGFDEQNVKIQIREYSRQIAAMFGDDIKTLIAQNELRMKQLADLHLKHEQSLKDVDKLKRGHNISLKVIKRENDDILRNWASRLDSLNKQQTHSVAENDRLRIQNKDYVGAIKNWTSKVEALNKELAELKAENERLSTRNKDEDVSIKRWISRVQALDEELAVLKFENACLRLRTTNKSKRSITGWDGPQIETDRRSN